MTISMLSPILLAIIYLYIYRRCFVDASSISNLNHQTTHSSLYVATSDETNSLSPLPNIIATSVSSILNNNTEHIARSSLIYTYDKQDVYSENSHQQIGLRERRIVGGNKTYEGEFPWAVSIHWHGNHVCGGVIIDKRWILTAAHCIYDLSVSDLLVRTGVSSLSKSMDNKKNVHLKRDYIVDQAIMHNDFVSFTGSFKKIADIALLKLKSDILWNKFTWPVRIPDKKSGNFSGHEAIVIGWGRLNERSLDHSDELQKVKLTIIDNKVCQNWFEQAGEGSTMDDRIICAGFKDGGKDSCHGDSGGPLLRKINGLYEVVGVVSSGIGCARPLLPGLYTRVSSYVSWIEKYAN